MKGALVQIKDSTDPLRSDRTLLVAALLTLGIPPAGRELFYCTAEPGRGETVFECVWTLAAASRCGRFASARMVKAWDDPQWLLANSGHPLALLRCGLTYAAAMRHTPRYTLRELAEIETPDTWVEAACRNLITLLRDIPRVPVKGTVRFGPNWSAFVPQSMPEDRRTRFLKYVETQDPAKRRAILQS